MSQPPQYGDQSTARQAYRGRQAQQDAGQLPQHYRQGLDSVAQAVAVCGWCAEKCIESASPNRVECIKLCEDVAELGEALLALGPRSSRFTADLARTFERAAQTCAQECAQHSDSHCQECAAVLPQAAQSVQQLTLQGGQRDAAGQPAQQFSP